MTDEKHLKKIEKNANAREEIVEYIKQNPEIRDSYYKFVMWCKNNNTNWLKALYRFPKIKRFFYN